MAPVALFVAGMWLVCGHSVADVFCLGVACYFVVVVVGGGGISA